MMDTFHFLIWNVRGLNRAVHRDVVRQVVEMVRPAIVCLQETKLASISHRRIVSMLGVDFVQFTVLQAQGTSGGILVAWKGSIHQALTSRIDEFSVSVQFVIPNDTTWWFTWVYGPSQDACRRYGIRGFPSPEARTARYHTAPSIRDHLPEDPRGPP